MQQPVAWGGVSGSSRRAPNAPTLHFRLRVLGTPLPINTLHVETLHFRLRVLKTPLPNNTCRWEELLEEAYEGWGPKPAPQEEGRWRKQETNLRGLFPHPGVVYPILPTGGMRLPRPSPGLFSSENDGSASVEGTRTLGETRRVRFVVQVRVPGRSWGLGDGLEGSQRRFTFILASG